MHQTNITDELRAEPSATLSRVFADNRELLQRFVANRMSRQIKGRVDASDIVQETYAEAFKRLDEYLENPSIPFLKWLYMLADQNAAAAYRKHVGTQKRSTDKEQPVHSDASSFFSNDLQRVAVSDHTGPLQHFARMERRMSLERAISTLPVPSQAVVRMRFLEGKSLAEISEALGLSVDAVSKRAMRSLVKLSNVVEEYGLSNSWQQLEG